MIIAGRSNLGKAIQRKMAKIIREGESWTKTYSGQRYYWLHDMEVIVDETTMILMNRSRNEGKLRLKWSALLYLQSGNICI